MGTTDPESNPVPVPAPRLWASGDVYEPYVGRWSRVVAREFIEWLEVAEGASWLDVGCGTGALTTTILQHEAPREVVGIDASTGFVTYCREHIRDARARFEEADAQALPVENGQFDAAVSGLVLNFAPDPARMASEMSRVVRPGGIVGLYVWDYADRMEMMRHFWDVAGELDPAAAKLDESLRFPICQPDPLERLFGETGLSGVTSRAIDIPTVFPDFDDYWLPFLGGQAPAPAYARSLDANRLSALRERLRATLPTEPDGSIRLVARAWAVRGRR